MHYIMAAWQQINQQTIQNCFRKAGYKYQSDGNEMTNNDDDDDFGAIVFLRRQNTYATIETTFLLGHLVYIYRVSQEECGRLREGVPYAKIYRYNPKHICPKWNGYGDNGQRILKL